VSNVVKTFEIFALEAHSTITHCGKRDRVKVDRVKATQIGFTKGGSQFCREEGKKAVDALSSSTWKLTRYSYGLCIGYGNSPSTLYCVHTGPWLPATTTSSQTAPSPFSQLGSISQPNHSSNQHNIHCLRTQPFTLLGPTARHRDNRTAEDSHHKAPTLQSVPLPNFFPNTSSIRRSGSILLRADISDRSVWASLSHTTTAQREMHSYRGRSGPSKATPSNVQCQKCLKRDK
jgi:hypothetical protein